MKTIAEDKFDAVIRECHIFLKAIGFKKKGNSFFRKRSGIGHHINFQKGSFRTKDDISFTINIGFFLPEYWNFHNYSRRPIPEFPNSMECILSRRIGKISGGNEIWWEIDKDTDVAQLKNVILQNVKDVIIPYFNEVETKNELKDFINFQTLHFGSMPYEKMISLCLLGDINNAGIEYDRLKKDFRFNLDFLATLRKYAKEYGLE